MKLFYLGLWNETAQQVKVLATQACSPESSSGKPCQVGGENQLHKVSYDLHMFCVAPLLHTYKINRILNNFCYKSKGDFNVDMTVCPIHTVYFPTKWWAGKERDAYVRARACARGREKIYQFYYQMHKSLLKLYILEVPIVSVLLSLFFFDY